MEKRLIITVRDDGALDFKYNRVTFLEMLGIAEVLNFECKLKMNEERNRTALLAAKQKNVSVKKTKKK